MRCFRGPRKGLWRRRWCVTHPTSPRMARTDRHHRDALRETARSEVASKVRTAIVELDRTKADLLRDLSLDALESEEGGAS